MLGPAPPRSAERGGEFWLGPGKSVAPHTPERTLMIYGYTVANVLSLGFSYLDIDWAAPKVTSASSLGPLTSPVSTSSTK
jgi:hypothetical protein